MKRETFDTIERLVIDYSGPLGKFVVIKTIKDLGHTPESYPEDKNNLRKLVKRILQRAIFDENRRNQAEKEILKELSIH